MKTWASLGQLVACGGVLSLLAWMNACEAKIDVSLGVDAGVVDEGPPPIDYPPPESRFTVPDSLSALDEQAFFDHPWPSDFRREADGTVRFDGYVNPRKSPLLAKYIAQVKGKVDGFSPIAAGYLAFSAPLDVSKLPVDAKASLETSSALQLVDVDDKSPELGKRRPLLWRFRDRVGDYYTVPNVLSWSPVIGNPLRPKTRYAIVATNALKGVNGKPTSPNADLKKVLDGTGKLGTAWAPAIAHLVKAGVSKDSIVHLSIFTTMDPVAELLAVAEDARAQPAPTIKEIKLEDASTKDFDRYEGIYQGSPDYQQGTVPFLSDGGAFVFDPETKKPVKQRDFELRFKLVVPNAEKCPMPAAGYPIVLYAHGTTGDYSSFIGDGTAQSLATKCLASMGIDQIFHGTRPGAPALDDPNRDSKISLLFFNLSNAISSRTSPRQAAVDEIARARMITAGNFYVLPEFSKTGLVIMFDPKRIGFFGHSQGGLNGPLLFATDDQTRGGVLSGAGSNISYSLLLKTKPDPSVAGLVKSFLGISEENADELTEMHPAISFVQTVIDPADAVHYYGATARSPVAGHKPKSVLMTEGVNADGSGDNFAPPRTIEAGAIAGGYPLVAPVVRDIPELTGLAGMPPASTPFKGNVAGGTATIGIAQFSPNKRDGHFVVFEIAKAREMTTNFCASLLGDGVPTIK